MNNKYKYSTCFLFLALIMVSCKSVNVPSEYAAQYERLKQKAAQKPLVIKKDGTRTITFNYSLSNGSPWIENKFDSRFNDKLFLKILQKLEKIAVSQKKYYGVGRHLKTELLGQLPWSNRKHKKSFKTLVYYFAKDRIASNPVLMKEDFSFFAEKVGKYNEDFKDDPKYNSISIYWKGMYLNMWPYDENGQERIRVDIDTSHVTLFASYEGQDHCILYFNYRGHMLESEPEVRND